MTRDTVIYCLRNPDDNTIWYVGKTHVGLEQRLYQHLLDARRGTSDKCKWIRSLIQQDKRPIIEKIEVCEHEFWPQKEQAWIDHYRKINPNLTNGEVVRLTPDKKEDEPPQAYQLWTKTIRKLSLLRGLTNETAISIVDRLVTAELERVQKEQGERGQ